MTWATRNAGAARAGIAILVLFLYGTTMAMLAYSPLPEANKEVFVVLVGGLSTALGTVVGYFFSVQRRPDANH